MVEKLFREKLFRENYFLVVPMSATGLTSQAISPD